MKGARAAWRNHRGRDVRRVLAGVVPASCRSHVFHALSQRWSHGSGAGGSGCQRRPPFMPCHVPVVLSCVSWSALRWWVLTAASGYRLQPLSLGAPTECLHQPALPLGLPPVCPLPVGGGVAQWLCLRSVKQVTGVRFLALVAVLWWTGVPLGRPGWGTGAAELHGAWDPWATEVGAQPTDVVVGLLPVLGVRMPPALRHQPFPWPAGGPQLPPPAFQRRVRPATTPPAGATGWRASPRAGHRRPSGTSQLAVGGAVAQWLRSRP